MASCCQEVRYPLGEGSDKMATVSLFQSKITVHVRQFHTDSYGKKGITLSVKEFHELLRYVPSMCTDILRMDVELKNLDNGKLGILPPAEPDTTMLSDPMSKSPRDSPMSLDDGKIEILPPTAEPDVTMLSDPVLKSTRDSPMSLDDGKIEILPPADLDVTMFLDPPSVSPRESQFEEPITKEPLLSTPKLDIENLFVDSPHHSGVDEVKSVLWEKEIEKFGGKLNSVSGEECLLGLFGATEEQVSDAVKESEE